MKYIVSTILLILAGCSEEKSKFESIAVQHIGRGIMNGDACKTLYRKDENPVEAPFSFKITPFEAIEVAKEQLDYSCLNKLGSEIFSDGKSYYIVRLGIMKDAIIINGSNGKVESKGFMGKDS